MGGETGGERRERAGEEKKNFSNRVNERGEERRGEKQSPAGKENELASSYSKERLRK